MKRLCTPIVIIILFLGCSNKNYIDMGSEYIKGEDAQYMMMEDSSKQWITSGEDGYYFINGYYLYYCDYNELEAIPMCSKPNCLHDKELNETKKFNCNAFLIADSQLLLTIYNNYIYCYISDDWSIDIMKGPTPEIIRISLDGSERKTICQLEENIMSMALHRGKLYYATVMASNNYEEERIGINEFAIKEYDIFNKYSEAKVIESGKGIGVLIHNIMPVGNKVVYKMYSVENNIFQSNYMIYDLKEKNLYKASEGLDSGIIGLASISGNDLIFSPECEGTEELILDEYMYKANLETGRIEKLFKKDFTEIIHFSDENYIYVDNISDYTFNEDKYNYDIESFQREITVYDKQGNKVDSIDVDNIGGYEYFISGDDKYTFIKGEDDKGAYIRYIDKSKIGTGTAKLKTLFELDRKYMDLTLRKVLE